MGRLLDLPLDRLVICKANGGDAFSTDANSLLFRARNLDVQQIRRTEIVYALSCAMRLD